jgi:hypothetical protein
MAVTWARASLGPLFQRWACRLIGLDNVCFRADLFQFPVRFPFMPSKIGHLFAMHDLHSSSVCFNRATRWELTLTRYIASHVWSFSIGNRAMDCTLAYDLGALIMIIQGDKDTRGLQSSTVTYVGVRTYVQPYLVMVDQQIERLEWSAGRDRIGAVAKIYAGNRMQIYVTVHALDNTPYYGYLINKGSRFQYIVQPYVLILLQYKLLPDGAYTYASCMHRPTVWEPICGWMEGIDISRIFYWRPRMWWLCRSKDSSA